MKNSKTSQKKLNFFVSRTLPKNSTNILFDNNSLKIYMLVEEKENLIDVYHKTNLDIETFILAVKKLFKQGLLVRVGNEQFISPRKIEGLKSSLANYVGPVAQVIVADAFASLGLANERLPVPKIDLLIEKISDQIPHEKAVEFKKSAERVMNSSA